MSNGREKSASRNRKEPETEFLFQVGATKSFLSLPLSIFISVVLLVPVDFVNIAVMEFKGPVSRPLMSRQLFSKCYTPVFATLTETAHHELSRTIFSSFGSLLLLCFLGDLSCGLVSF